MVSVFRLRQMVRRARRIPALRMPAGTTNMTYIHIGIPKPELADGREERHLSINELRALIYRSGHRDSALIRQCVIRAEVEGLCGEDTMTVIAYHALRRLEDMFQDSVRFRIDPIPPVVPK